jgi:hypothetical protein
MTYAGTTPIETKDLIILALKTISMLVQEFQAADLGVYFSFHPLAQHLLVLCVLWLASSAGGGTIRCSLQFACLLWYVDRWVWSHVVAAYEDTAVLALGGKAVIAKDRTQLLCMALARLLAGMACITAPALVAAAVGVLTVVPAGAVSLSQASNYTPGFVFILCFYAVLGCTINAARLALFDANSMLEKTSTSLGIQGANRMHMYQRAPYLTTMPATLKVEPKRVIKKGASTLRSRIKRTLCAILRFCYHYDINALLFYVLVQIKLHVKYVFDKLVRHVVVPILTRSTAENSALVPRPIKKP